MKLYETAQIVREAIFKKRSEERNILGKGSLSESIKELDILLSFINNGHHVGKQLKEFESTKAVIKSTGHLVSFHTAKRRKEDSTIRLCDK